MIVTIAPDRTVRVSEHHDLRMLSVQGGGFSIAEIAGALEQSGLGRARDDHHVDLKIDALRSSRLDRAEDTTWLVAFDAMIVYAAKSGWVAADGTMVRAHVEN